MVFIGCHLSVVNGYEAICSANLSTRANGIDMFQNDLKRMEMVPDQYYNFHPGAHTGQGVEKGIEQIAVKL